MKVKKNTHLAEKLKSLIEVGVALSSEKELPNLMQLFLENCLEVCQAEGASIYLLDRKTIEQQPEKGLLLASQKIPVLKFLRTMNRTSGSREHHGLIDINKKSLAGYCALSKQTLSIDDCYDLPIHTPYRFNDEYDKKSGYKTKSVLVVPMITSHGQVRGVLQLINKLNDEGLDQIQSDKQFSEDNVISFTEEDQELMGVFASQAAVAIENAQLTESIENLFESFVRASIKTIEARDPTTSGHSDRVATLTVELSLAVHKSKSPLYRNISFSEEQVRELRYAALLHDFGKIGVKEGTLLKQKKLHARELESILLRLDTMEQKQEVQIWRRFGEDVLNKLAKNEDVNETAVQNALQFVQTEVDGYKLRLRQLKSGIIQANEPYVVKSSDAANRLMQMIEDMSNDLGQQILTDKEIKTLAIPKGSLNQEERREIESHVSHTYDFLKQIAWTEALQDVAHIAHCHHEKMDGSGYPRGIRGNEIPIQSRMMTIADIYDALIAFDRPYKKALTPDKAIDILLLEANQGKLDMDLLTVFIDARIFDFIHHLTQQAKAS